MTARESGFTLLPVIMAMTVIGAIAFALNRANAFTAQGIAGRSDFERARYAAEAGLQAVNYAVQQKSCLGGFPTTSSPVIDTAFGGAAYSAHAGAASGSPVTLTSTGTYKGASVTLNRSVRVYQTAVRTHVHQPGESSGKDTYFETWNPNVNLGNRTRFEVGNGTESVIRFDLSFFPAGSRIVTSYDVVTATPIPGARLELYRNSPDTSIAAGSYLDVHYVNQVTWLEHSATWNTYDGFNPWPAPRYDARPVSTVATRREPGWQQLDVTDAAIAWMGSTYANSGLWLRGSPTGAPNPNLKFASSDDDDQSWRRPRLVLNYLLPCGASAP